MKHLTILLLTCVTFLPSARADQAGKERVAQLLEAMGGRKVWAATTTVVVEATHFNLRAPTHYANRIVNDFTRPRVRFEGHAPGWDRWSTLEDTTGYSRKDDQAPVVRSAERIAEDLAWWEANIYRTLHRLARRDPDLEPKAVGEDRLEIHTAKGRLNWFRLDADGAPVLYGTGEESAATIFGPLVSTVTGQRYPAWGAGNLGAWRYQVDRFVANPSLTKADFKIPVRTPNPKS